ncbi:hypothetical protein BS47DRAFT_1362639 [Hydnum rufescens UP504]|uniref:Uncharacterized protein n=1 Tax=Hydnum rufescens UP504 TaxID=1448309 RepID=A0A9P6AWY9_9AGAM|nr:hypothetical protein BS47DRAFT_1362639 [Hydnum rufescens UP504]
MVREWEIDASKPYPYTLPLSNKSQAQICLELIEMERDLLYHGNIEDTQNSHWMSNHIKTFHDIQKIYMPEACHFLTSKDECEKPSHPETIKLFLPSQIPVEYCMQNTIMDIEVKLHVGQAFDALSSLHSLLCIQAHLTNYKQTVQGQHMHTCVMALIESAKCKTASIAAKYTVSHQTLISLMGLDSIDPQLKELRDWDVCMLSDPEISEDKQDSHTQNLSKGSWALSWIWMSAAGNGDNETHEGGVFGVTQLIHCPTNYSS